MNDNALTAEACRDYGEKFLAQGFWEDALEFFLKGNYQPGLQQLQEHALEEGDAYLLSRLGTQPPETWRRLAEQALKLEKLHSARRALEQAGDREEAEEVAGRLAASTH